MRTRLPRNRILSTRYSIVFTLVLGLGFLYYKLNRFPSNYADLYRFLKRSPAWSPTQCTANVYSTKLVGQAVNNTNVLNRTTTTNQDEADGDRCSLKESSADIDTVAIYPSFEFQPNWMESKEFWDQSFEDRFNDKCPSRPTLKAMKKLIAEGRLEITTGGWVMPDEACTHIYALIDQFIEGHTWVKTNLGLIPKTGWSIDPFGHGPTVPHLLDQSGLEGAIIQRIHYAWKQWLAQRQIEEFYWIPGWSTNKPNLVVHNQPFDIYSVKNTCGPHRYVCLDYDFAVANAINNDNLRIKSKTLIEEYARIGSLTPHNVVLVPLGDDFRYGDPFEFDAQYTNYMKMFNYINSHKDEFNAEVQFGTPLDYFNAVKERHKGIPTLKGDFFVYSDIFSEGRPAYWSGYFTTRPYLKILARQLEHQLRTAEILFTLVANFLKKSSNQGRVATQKILVKYYQQLIIARRNLGLFQHHDGITGTSQTYVMFDYETKLFTSMYDCIQLQEIAIATIMLPDKTIYRQNVIKSEIRRVNSKPAKFKFEVSLIDRKKVILFNPLAEQRTEVITLLSNTTNIRVYDTRQREYVLYQVTPNIDVRADGKRVISETTYEIMFVATLPPLSSVTFSLEEHTNRSHHCEVFCLSCQNEPKKGKKPPFVTKKTMPGDIQLENSALTLLIDKNTGFLRQIYRKDIKKKIVVEMKLDAYQSTRSRSGAYLFMPDSCSPEKNVLLPYSKWKANDDNIIIVSGPVSTDVTAMYLPFLKHTIRIYNVEDPVLSRGVLIENIVDFGDPPKNQETELFMRIQTDIQNGDPPEFYTDQNGYQYQKRVKIDKLGIEANYYPITTMAWLQDEETRMTLITNHAQGASAFQPGLLEVMLDRRTLYDDNRGLGEGVEDNKPTVFQNWLLLESMAEPRPKDSVYALPSQMADYMSRAMNYPVNVYLVDTSDVGEVEVKNQQTLLQDFPAGIHLLTLRTITDENRQNYPSSQCFMVLQRSGFDCHVGISLNRSTAFSSRTQFNDLRIRNLTAVSLTGLKTYANLEGLHSIKLERMEVKSFKIQF